MNKYDLENQRFQQWVMYFLVFSLGCGFGMTSEKSNSDKDISKLYSSLPVSYQAEADLYIQGINDMNEALSQ